MVGPQPFQVGDMVVFKDTRADRLHCRANYGENARGPFTVTSIRIRRSGDKWIVALAGNLYDTSERTGAWRLNLVEGPW